VSAWDEVTASELRIAAKVARASGGPIMAGAASAWELRARLIEERSAVEQLSIWLHV
jgi:hypothetical protein